jgi:GTPase SAR1 family protein
MVGKTQLINRFTNDKFSELHGKAAKEVESKEWMHEGKLYLLEAKEIDDSTPEEEIKTCIHKADAVVFVFDLTSIESYDVLS